MPTPFGKIKALFSTSPEADPAALQESFRSRYRNFRALLTANNNALELMAEMEQALDPGTAFRHGLRPRALHRGFGQCLQDDPEPARWSPTAGTAVCTIPSGRSPPRWRRYWRASRDVPAGRAGRAAVGSRQGRRRSGRRQDGQSRRSAQPASASRFPKASSSPPRPRAVHGGERSAGRDQPAAEDPRYRRPREPLFDQRPDPEADQQRAACPRSWPRQIMDHYEKLSPAGQERAADLDALQRHGGGQAQRFLRRASTVRSSMSARISSSHTYKEIVASKYQSQAIIYRNQRGFRHQDVIMCVGCMVMVDAAVSGVMFSRSPRNPRSHWVEINAAHGLASQVVVGSVETDFYKVGREVPNVTVCSRDCAAASPAAGRGETAGAGRRSPCGWKTISACRRTSNGRSTGAATS